jgi:hypothetical protein
MTYKTVGAYRADLSQPHGVRGATRPTGQIRSLKAVHPEGLSRLDLALDLALCLGMHRGAAYMALIPGLIVVRQLAGV